MQPKRLLPPYEVFLETRWFLPGSASEPFTLAGRRVGALGYGTLWGDLAGLLSPIGDLPKTEVVRLSRWVARTRGTIPQFVLERPPSAELSEGHVDPFDYGSVAPGVEAFVSNAGGADESLRAAVRRAEGKRVVHGIVLKASRVRFGSGRLVPVTRAY